MPLLNNQWIDLRSTEMFVQHIFLQITLTVGILWYSYFSYSYRFINPWNYIRNCKFCILYKTIFSPCITKPYLLYILTSVWHAQHPNAGRNIQHITIKVCSPVLKLAVHGNIIIIIIISRKHILTKTFSYFNARQFWWTSMKRIIDVKVCTL